MESSRPAARPEQRQLFFAKLAEDFKHIQVVNNELTLATAQGTMLDFKFVAKSASEIKRRAQRLKLNLVLPELDDAPRNHHRMEDKQLGASLSLLSGLIVRFVRNPIFQEVNVIDAQFSAKARRDLEEIIELSGQVKKSSEKLSKTAQRSK